MKRPLLNSVLFAAFAFVAAMPMARAGAADEAAPIPGAEAVKKDDAAPAGKAPAADANTTPAQAPAVDPEAVKKQERYSKAAQAAYDAVKDIGKGLKEDDAKHFYMIYQNYNMIGTVKMVQGDVGNAINACGTANPDKKADMDARYKTWGAAIDDVVKDAEANVNNMIAAQDYAPPTKIRDAFKKIDDARAITNSYVDKKPVTSPEACDYLMKKMDETQDNLVKLLRSTLVSVGKAFPETGSQKAVPAGDKPVETKKP